MYNKFVKKVDKYEQIFYNEGGDIMERQILHVDVNNAFLSWTAVEMLKNGSKVDIREMIILRMFICLIIKRKIINNFF